jgi:type IV pilus biogenesis protein CpaD/CtpE
MTRGRVAAAAVRRGLLASILAVLVAGCASAPIGPVTLRTQPPSTVCEAARVAGVLVADPAYGLAYKEKSGTRGVVWPNGYSARRGQDGVVVLIDPSGRVIAREGDAIQSMGNWHGDNIAFPCGDLYVNPSPAP